ncbi:hypothetical protein C8R46DRAFT_596510 [Mycena filopes]|nr:hypothetical protein C8R46DRAFT_596510 [Mycena filopes]
MMLAREPFPSGYLPRRHSLTPLVESSLSSAHEFGYEYSGAHTDSSVLNTRKPLRSSPLAGPALSSSEGAPDDERAAIRRVRRLSTPNLRPLARADTPPPIPPLLTSPAVKRPSKRVSFIELVKRPLGHKPQPPPLPLPSPLSISIARSSINHTPPSPPLPSPRRRSHARSPSSMAASMSSPDLSIFSISPPNFPRALTAPPSRRTSTIPLPSAHTRDPSVPVYGVTASRSGLLSDDTWLAAMPYDSIPRFSRHSLTASNVVFPVSASDARRKSFRGEGGQRISLAYPAPMPVTPPRCSSLADPTSCRPPSLLRSRSRSLSSEGPTTPSDSSSVFSGDSSIMLAEDDDPLRQRDAIDLERVLDPAVADNDGSVVHALKMTLVAAARSTWSLSSLRRHRPTPVPAPADPESKAAQSKAAPSFVSSAPRDPSVVSSHSDAAPSFVSSSSTSRPTSFVSFPDSETAPSFVSSSFNSRPPSFFSSSPSADAPASTTGSGRRSYTPSPLAARLLSTKTLLAPYTVTDFSGYDPYADLWAPPPPRSAPAASKSAPTASKSAPAASKKPVGTVRRMFHSFPGVRRLKT